MTRPLRILYLGPFQYSWGTETHIAHDLTALGHTVEIIKEPAAVDELARRAKGCDLLIWTRQRPMHPEAGDLWRALEEQGTRTCGWHLDLYRGLAREATVAGDPFWQLGTVFTADGDPASQRWFEAQGINHRWLPAGVYSVEAYPEKPMRQAVPPIAFVGSTGGYPHEWPWRQELLGWLTAKYGAQFKVYPQGRAVRGRDLNRLYATTTVVVGDSLCLLWPCERCAGEGWSSEDDARPCTGCGGSGERRHRDYWSDRPYETVGRGGFLVFPLVPGLDAHFTDTEHLRFFDYGDFDQLGSIIDHYLDHPDEARVVALNGQHHVKEHHTYQHRARQALAMLGLD